LIGTATALGGGEWVTYVEDTAVRMPAALNDPSVSTADLEEKDYIWGDVDNDGDIDLICVRKEPFTVAGGHENVLWLNEGIADGHAVNGVLVDRSDLVITQAGDAGDGFRDLTNDRDVALLDVNGDGWIDLVTATTHSPGQAKYISHPRIYVNRGERAGVWQGMQYEADRIPQLFTLNGLGQDVDPVYPLFCSVDAGDLTGDGRPELFFGDYDGSGGGGLAEPPNFDLDDRMLLNDGTGFFTDSRFDRCTPQVLSSAFGQAVELHDMNGDGAIDVVKSTGLNNPLYVSQSINDGAGNFTDPNFDIIYPNAAPYFVEVGHLNSDGRLDIVITDDAVDAYMINQGNDGSGNPTWSTHALPSVSNDFGSNIAIADLDNDGRNDILIADVDVDIPGCSRRMHIYRNQGPDLGTPGFAEIGNVIPANMLTGTHDVAVFDIDGDGWQDMVIGRCTGTEVWMNNPAQGLVLSYPGGVPTSLSAGQTTQIEVEVSGLGGAVPEDDTGMQYVSVNGGPFDSTSMVFLGGNTYQATLPAIECPGELSFYFSVEDSVGGTFFDPASAPGSTYSAMAIDGTEVERDEFEGDTSGWTVTDDPSLTSGSWEVVDPNGTLVSGSLAAPEDDASNGAENVLCFVTENGSVGGAAATNDIDGGPTILTSPVIDLEDADAEIAVSLWAFTNGDDVLITQVSNGGPWVEVTALTVSDTGSAWESRSFVVGDYVEPSDQTRVRFIASDNPNNNVSEAGVDNFQVTKFICEDPVGCAEDCASPPDGQVDVTDLLELLSQWSVGGTCDFDGGGVSVSDLLQMLSAWGNNCP
jgi:hypothetical protein